MTCCVSSGTLHPTHTLTLYLFTVYSICACVCAVGRVLLNAGADIGARDNDGWTPLHAAAHWGQTESCEILAHKFASFKAIDNAVCTGQLIISVLLLACLRLAYLL